MLMPHIEIVNDVPLGSPLFSKGNAKITFIETADITGIGR